MEKETKKKEPKQEEKNNAAGTVEYTPVVVEPETLDFSFKNLMKRFWKNYFRGRGRASRKEYWMTRLYVILLLAGLLVIDYMVISSGAVMYIPLSLLCSIAVIIPDITIAVRRLHDVGKSAAILVISYILPLAWIILLIFLCGRTDEYVNNSKNKKEIKEVKTNENTEVKANTANEEKISKAKESKEIKEEKPADKPAWVTPIIAVVACTILLVVGCTIYNTYFDKYNLEDIDVVVPYFTFEVPGWYEELEDQGVMHDENFSNYDFVKLFTNHDGSSIYFKVNKVGKLSDVDVYYFTLNYFNDSILKEYLQKDNFEIIDQDISKKLDSDCYLYTMRNKNDESQYIESCWFYFKGRFYEIFLFQEGYSVEELKDMMEYIVDVEIEDN